MALIPIASKPRFPRFRSHRPLLKDIRVHWIKPGADERHMSSMSSQVLHVEVQHWLDHFQNYRNSVLLKLVERPSLCISDFLTFIHGCLLQWQSSTRLARCWSLNMTERPGTIQQTFITFKGMKVFPILSQHKMMKDASKTDWGVDFDPACGMGARLFRCFGSQKSNDASALHDTSDASRIGSGLCCSFLA